MDYPQLVVFDLDYTLWPCWCDTHLSPPIRLIRSRNVIQDKHQNEITFYEDVPKILLHLSDMEVPVISASRTHAPEIAKQMLKMLYVEHITAETFFYQQMYGTWSKTRHFRNIHEMTGIPYKNMILFDDESRNDDVESLGVTFMLVENGLTWETFTEGIAKWRRKAKRHNH